MDNSFVVELIQNIAFLLVFTFFYGKRWIERIHSKRIFPKVIIGVIVGAIGIFLCITDGCFNQGIV